jgi:CheY-like chemotaxis protein
MGFKPIIDIGFQLIKCKIITIYEKENGNFAQIYRQSFSNNLSNNFFYIQNLDSFNDIFLKNILTDKANIQSSIKIKNILGIPIKEKKKNEIVGFIIFVNKYKDFNDDDISKVSGIVSLIEKKIKRGKRENFHPIEQNILAHMNHQIRTPLNGVIGYNQLLARTKMTALQENYMTSINTCCFQLLQIVNDVLDYSRLNSGKVSCIEESFHLREIFDNIQDVLKNNIQYKKQKLLLGISDKCPEFIYCDKNKLTQILINLASNAVKFTGENGTININVESRENNCLLFTVSDNGIGIAEKDQGKLFDAFTRLNENSRESQNGTGLGLAIVKKLVGLFKGEIWVSSVLGQGTKFFFTINYKPMDIQEKIVKINQEKFLEKHVLLVDDNPDNRLIISEYLFDWKMIPIVCGSASEAFNLIIKKRYPFSLGLIDICMPITNGVQLARQIKNEFPFFPLIAISSSKELFNNTDFEYKIDKPVSKTLLFNLILKVFERQHTKNELLLANEHFSSDEENLGKSNSTDSLEMLERKDVDIFSKKILIAEDVEYNWTLLETVLKSLGYSNIDIAKNGREAIEKLSVENYDILFLDLKMPEIDGYGVIQYINNNEKKIEIIVVSASVLEDERKKCKRNGVKYFISKPIDIKNIADILDLINNI